MRIPLSALRGRTARSALAFSFLAPVIVLGMVVSAPGAAAATRLSGGTSSGTFELYDTFRYEDHVDCSLTAQYRVETGTEEGEFSQFIDVKGDCDSGHLNNVLDDEFHVDFVGSKPSGGYCADSAVGVITDNDEKFESSVAVVFSQQPSSFCHVQEACLVVNMQKNGPMDEGWQSGCFSLNMGEPKLPVGPTSACPAGKPGNRVSYVNARNPGGTSWEKAITARVTWLPQAAYPVNQLTVLWMKADGPDADIFPDTISSSNHTMTATTPFLEYEMKWSDTQAPAGPPSGPKDPVVAFQIYDNRTGSTTGFNSHFPNNDPNLTRLGMSKTSACEFYVGPRVQTREGTTEDDPFAALNVDDTDPVITTPVVEPDPSTKSDCTFDFTAPSTWLEGGMCSVVGLLGELLGAIGSLASAIANLAAAIFGPIVDALQALGSFIVDGLEAALGLVVDAVNAIWDGFTGLMSGLFVPDDGYLDAKTTQLQNDWNDTSVPKWGEAVSDMVPSTGGTTAARTLSGGGGGGAAPAEVGASGCDGVNVTIPLPGYTIDEQMGAACTGKMAEVAGLVRAVLSASVIVAGAFACLRALGSGLSWSPGVGRGDGSVA